MNINVNALKEAFYKQLYNDYTSFLKIHMKKDQTEVFSKTLNKYHGFDKEWDLGEIRNKSTTEDVRICASIEDFFNIIKTNTDALEYVSCMMQYIKNATTKVEGSWLQVEDTINKLILRHFWEQRCKGGYLKEEDELSFTTKDKDNKNIQIKLTFNDFCKDPNKVKEINIIELMGKLPPEGLDDTEKYAYNNYEKKFFTKHLNASRQIRNKFSHKEFLLPDNFADAVILVRFKLYSYLAATLCLGIKNPQIDTKLIIEDQSEKHDAKFRVYEVNIIEEKEGEKKEGEGKKKYEKISDALDCKHLPSGYEFTLKRCHNYIVEVSNPSLEEVLQLRWFSLSPIGTWNGIKLTLYDNDFEKVALNPSGTLSSILDTNKQIAETLAHIDKTLSEILDNKDQKKEDINKIILVLESLQKLQQDNYQSSQARFEALLGANKKQGKELVEVNSQLEKVNVTIGTQATKLAEIAELVAESINNDKKTNQDNAKLIKILIEEFTQTRKADTIILEQIRNNQEQKRRKDESRFFKKRLLIWLVLGAAAIGCILHCIYPQSLNWVLYKPWYIGSIILGPLGLIAGLQLIYNTTRRKELITNRVKKSDWGAIGLATLLWGIGIAVTPHPTEEELIQGFSWTNKDHVCQSFIEFTNDYLAKYPESEKARIKLGDYYLNIANDLQKALEVTAPMRDVEKYPIGCVYAAEAYYQCDSLLRVKDIIDKYKRYFPKTRMNGIERLYALLLIEGQGKVYDKGDPDQGLLILYRLAETGYLQACYDLGHWSATDLAEWKPGTEDVAPLRYDLPTAVKYLRRVSDNMPKAALELGNLYADLGVVDSAKHYIDLAIKQAKGELYSEALFNMGLLLERQGQPDNSFMEKAQDRDYTPAIEHKALLEKDHTTAIKRMKLAGLYKGSRTIPPIVFEYLKATESRDFTGLADSALKVLQNQRPECKFNRTFISAMEAIIGTQRMKKDLDSAMVLLRLSAEEGCLYAKMMCCYQDAFSDITKDRRINIGPLKDISPIIPFAGVLLSDLYIRAGKYYNAIDAALYPMSKNIPSAAFILSAIPVDYNISTDKNVTIYNQKSYFPYFQELIRSYLLQKIVRLSPYRNRWLRMCYISDTKKRNLAKDSLVLSEMWQVKDKQIPMPSTDTYFANNKEGGQLWIDALSASNFIEGKLLTAWRDVENVSYREKLVTSALHDLQQKNYNNKEELWQMWLFCLRMCSSDFQHTLLNERRDVKQRYYDYFQLTKDGRPTKTQIPLKFTFSTEGVLKFEPFDLYDQLDEHTSLIEELRTAALEHGL